MKKVQTRKVSPRLSNEQRAAKKARTKRREAALQVKVAKRVGQLAQRVMNLNSQLVNTQRENTAYLTRLKEVLEENMALKAKYEPKTEVKIEEVKG